MYKIYIALSNLSNEIMFFPRAMKIRVDKTHLSELESYQPFS